MPFQGWCVNSCVPCRGDFCKAAAFIGSVVARIEGEGNVITVEQPFLLGIAEILSLSQLSGFNLYRLVSERSGSK